MSSISRRILKKYMGEGLAGFDKSMGKDSLYDVLVNIMAGLKHRVVNGFDVFAPTTSSTQATGATGITAWRVDIGAGRAMVDGVAFADDATADFVIHSGTVLVVNGKSCVAAIIAKNVDGTVSIVAVKGAAALTGAQVAPTDTEIKAAIGPTVPWIKLAECTINRTGDTTVTQTQDNSLADVGIEVTVE